MRVARVEQDRAVGSPRSRHCCIRPRRGRSPQVPVGTKQQSWSWGQRGRSSATREHRSTSSSALTHSGLDAAKAATSASRTSSFGSSALSSDAITEWSFGDSVAAHTACCAGSSHGENGADRRSAAWTPPSRRQRSPRDRAYSSGARRISRVSNTPASSSIVSTTRSQWGRTAGFGRKPTARPATSSIGRSFAPSPTATV